MQQERIALKKGSLRNACIRRAEELYGPSDRAKALDRLQQELMEIRRIPNGAKAFAETTSFLQKIRNLCRSIQTDYDPLISFRGPALCSVCAYLMGITAFDPLANGLESWPFFMNYREIAFDISFPYRAFMAVRDYGLNPPACVTVFFGRDASILEELEENASNRGKSLSFRNNTELDRVVRDFFGSVSSAPGDTDWMDYFVAFDRKYSPQVEPIFACLLEKEMLPISFDELVRLIGFIHSSLLDKDYTGTIDKIYLHSLPDEFYRNMISSPEDIYERLTENGCDRSRAANIAMKVRSERKCLNDDDMILISLYYGKALAHNVSNVRHLFHRSQIMENGLLTVRMMRHYLDKKDEFIEAARDVLSL